MMRVYVSCTALLYVICGAVSAAESIRNILFIAADDLGWNDVGFHNPDMKTPNIDKLAYSGMILNQSYVQPVCTPSRSAWMTGYYPFRNGLQHLVILPEQATCLPLNRTVLPQHLKKLGYATHMLGKWHLGFCNWECTPTYRGFDTFYGYYNGAEDYYTHVVQNGKDFRDNKEPLEADGEYSACNYDTDLGRSFNLTKAKQMVWLTGLRAQLPTERTIRHRQHVYARKAGEIIKAHNQSSPLFLYLAFQSVHEPIQVPKKYEDMYSHISNQGRRQYCGMVSAMDEAIGNITKALVDAKMMDNTLIVFTADNGGWPQYYGNNYPLRGSKVTVFEGGTRATAFITGSGINASKSTYNGMMHAVDWMPTLVTAAGGEIDDKSMDGVNQWDAIQKRSASARNEFIYNLDDKFPPLTGHAAIRTGKYKLIDGYPGPYPGWYKPNSVEEDQEIKEFKPDEVPQKTMLFDIEADPNEHNDLSAKYPDLVKQMIQRLEVYRKQMVPANFPNNDPDSIPDNYDGFWTPGWC